MKNISENNTILRIKTLIATSFVFLFSALFLCLSGANAQEKDWFRVTHPHKMVCQNGEKDSFHCSARVITETNGKPFVTNHVIAGYTPLQLRSAYNLSSASASQTIAIVDAYDDPRAFSDLNLYSNTFGMQTLSSCAVSTGTPSHPCFQKVSQTGSTFYPRSNSGWALEISLDVQIAHGVCPTCNILLVEARSANYSDLMTAVDRARIMGAKIISNSYGSSEFSSETAFDSHFNFPGITFLFSSGDSGYGPSYPAASPYVVAVGGTSLFTNSDNSYNSESVWSGTGSGCSVFEAKPSWQTDNACGKRTIADVAADADPNTGAAIYDSFGYQGQSGWFQVGGTSLASPLIASVYALSGNLPTTVGASSLYGLSSYSGLHDITTGSNGSCGGSYLCNALAGYDGPTGWGTPLGTSAF